MIHEQVRVVPCSYGERDERAAIQYGLAQEEEDRGVEPQGSGEAPVDEPVAEVQVERAYQFEEEEAGAQVRVSLWRESVGQPVCQAAGARLRLQLHPEG